VIVKGASVLKIKLRRQEEIGLG